MQSPVLSHSRRLKVCWMRPTAFLLLGSFSAPLISGCGGQQAPTSSPAPPPGFSQNSRPAASQPRAGMSTKQKAVLLAGAAALYYIYKKRQAAKNDGPQGKYYISKSTGRVYYRDLKTGNFQWVSPPAQPIRVSPEEAAAYQNYQGYNNSQDGRGFGGYGTGRNRYNDAVPAQY